VRQIQGTLNGIGERCGNANLVTLIPTLMLKPAFSDRFETGIVPEKLAELTALSHGFDELLNRSPSTQSPYVGASASPPRPASMPRRCLRIRAPMSMCRPKASAISAR
jgi:2-isopropylmalate synthase